MRHHFHTVLPVDECRRRLRLATDQERLFGSDTGSAAVMGRIGAHRFRLYRRSETANPFAPRFYGHLKATGQGASVTGSVRVPLFTVVFCTLQFGVILFITLMSIVPTPWSVPVAGTSADLARFLGFPVIIGAGTLLVVFSRRLARGDDVELVRFVRNTLLATEQSV
jgi:hypothetical protein